MFPNLLGVFMGCSLVAFQNENIVPDLLDTLPQHFLKVTWPSKASAQLGNELTVAQTKDQPLLEWPISPSMYGWIYTLVMVDIDAPTHEAPTNRSEKHWVVVNAPDYNANNGFTLTTYKPPNPTKGSGLHRYVILAYNQTERLTLDPDDTNLEKFDVNQFATQNKLGKPFAGNFFQVRA